MILALLASAWGGSLDLLDVGGLWGSPAGSDAPAVWWNPGALAAGRGTRITLEIAPTIAAVNMDRYDPDWGGVQQYRYFGVAPFLGVVTDGGVPGLGLGAAVYVPVARGARAVDPDGPGRSSFREGDIRTIAASLAASYQILGKVSLGASVSYLYGSWAAELDSEVATALADELVAENGGTQTDYYPDDAVIQDPRYQTLIGLKGLAAHDVSFGVGLHARPIPQLELAVAYQHGWTAAHRGTATLSFDCPPSSDTLGRFGAEAKGLCDADMEADAVVAYRYPKRVHVGVAVSPVPELRLEAFGGWVGWSTFTDFDIDLSNVRSLNTTLDDETTALLNKQRLWARDNRDTFFVGLDASYRLKERWRFGVRGTFDRAAVPDHALAPNNFDADTLLLGAQIGFAPIRQVEIALSFTEKVSFARDVRESAFDVAIDPAERLEDRYFYPGMAGRYTAAIHRVALSTRLWFDGQSKRSKRASRDMEEN